MTFSNQFFAIIALLAAVAIIVFFALKILIGLGIAMFCFFSCIAMVAMNEKPRLDK